MYEELIQAYAMPDTKTICLGGIVVDGKLVPDAAVHLVLKQFNRHGLVAGATGSGKTKTLQVLAEQLSLAGVPSLVMDVKGDISGLAMPGEHQTKLEERSQSLGLTFQAQGFPVELLSLSEHIKGVPLRATIQDFGPLLFSRMLELNDTQSGVIAILFGYAKDKGLLLIDLSDFKELLKFSQTEAGIADIEKQYGRISAATVGTIMRKLIEIESQEGGYFFGEPAFDVKDLMRFDTTNKGIISILRVMDMQDKPFLFSTFMVKMLSDLYRQLPEAGDLEKPKLVLFIDEAHLIFNNAAKPLLNLLDTIVKLIRSKGVGLIFCTQTPKDVPENILSQLGLKIQHSLRAFTANDRKAIELTAKNFPPSKVYKTEDLLTSLGIGEALMTAIDLKGIPTPLIQCMVRPPESRMGILDASDQELILARSVLQPKYQNRLERDSAREYFQKQVTVSAESVPSAKPEPSAAEINLLDKLSKNTLFRQIIRDLFNKMIKLTISMLKKK
jgi:DNA helicase HerA-like ATPase